jgi:hypothetical protein
MASIKFIEPMYARVVERLPEGRDWLYEIKKLSVQFSDPVRVSEAFETAPADPIRAAKERS